MKFTGGLALLLALGLNNNQHDVEAFAPAARTAAQRPSTTARAFSPMMDPSNHHHYLADLPNQIQSLQDAFSSMSLADLDVDAMSQSVDPSGAVEEAAQKSGNGWFGFLTGPTMAFLQVIHSGFVAVGLDKNSWGLSIIALTVIIKLLTFPLTKAQLESTQKMQVGIVVENCDKMGAAVV